jgi:O-methyltransferase
MNKYLNFVKLFLKKQLIVDETMLGLSRERRLKIPRISNYIRISTLELVAQEIYERKVEGSVAEVGVYKGQFAKYLNKVFPDRTLYLFDTFEGFDAKDIAIEKQNNFSTGNQDFGNTSINEVMGKMSFPEKCIIKKGWFPESLQGQEDTYCFVSLDADLYKPVYDGLEHFYPRLNKGGYIFVHDYNNSGYEGAKRAVREFCDKYGLSFVPMTDTWGSAVITK